MSETTKCQKNNNPKNTRKSQYPKLPIWKKHKNTKITSKSQCMKIPT